MSQYIPSMLAPDLILRTRWYIYARWFLLLAIVIPGLLAIYVGEGLSGQFKRDALLGAAAIASNGIFYLIARVAKNNSLFKILAVALLATDILLISSFIFINGGIESRSPILYAVPILMSAALFGKKAIYKTTFAAVAAYDSLILADYFNIIHSIGAFDPTLRSQFPYVLSSVVFFSSILMIIGLVTDFITRLLIDKEKQVSKSLEALKNAQAVAKFGSWEWDALNDKIYWSDELYRIFGVKKDGNNTSYKDYLKIVHPEDRKYVNAEIKKALKKSKYFSFDHRIVRPNDMVRYIHSSGQSILDESGNVSSLIGTARDITEAKSLYEARNEFVSLASHQLRTPATGVKQYIGLLLEGYAGKLTSDQRSFLRTAYESNERQLSIVNDLLNLAQIDSGTFKLRKSRVELVQFIKTIIKEHGLKFQNKNQTVLFKSQYKQIYSRVDEARLRMAIDNMIDNAHKYTSKNKTIKINLTKNSSNIYLYITDEGVGIAKKDIPKIFRKFSRIENPITSIEDGTGLGLYLAKKVILLHGGKIEVESRLNKGTKFKIILPDKK